MEAGMAYAVQTDVPYYTQARDYTDTRILRQFRQRPEGRTQAYLGEVSVTTSVVGFKRVAHITEESLGEEYVDLPPQSYDTISLWFDVPPDTLEHIRRNRLDLMGGLHAVELAAIGVLPLFAMCDRNDIGGISTPLHPDTGRPQVFIHDGIPGGGGITEHGYEIIEELWGATLQVITECPCESGCPGCIQSPKCGNNNEPLNKGVAGADTAGDSGRSGRMDREVGGDGGPHPNPLPEGEGTQEGKGFLGGLWRDGDFVKFWVSRTVSNFGILMGALQFVAVLVLDATPFQMGVLGALGVAPSIIIGFFVGVVADRIRRRPILIVSELGRFALLASIPVAYLFGQLRIEQLYAVAFFKRRGDDLLRCGKPFVPAFAGEAQGSGGREQQADGERVVCRGYGVQRGRMDKRS